MGEYGKYVITGGAGYIGSLLTRELLRRGCKVAVMDKLMFGGDHMISYMGNDNFKLVPVDILEKEDSFYLEYFKGANAVIHLAALVGFPACQQVGKEVATRYNVDATKRMFDLANQAKVPRFFFASTYSNYGVAEDDRPVTEDSPLNPQSLYAETKIEAEKYLLGSSGDCWPIVFRFSTLFGMSPRTRFDLIINQFVLEALVNRKIIIYQKNYRRSFCHVYDTVRCVANAVLDWRLEHYKQVWNIGFDEFNLSKEDVIDLIKHQIDVEIEYKDLSFGGDMRDITVSFAKLNNYHAFDPSVYVSDGITEIRTFIQSGIIKDPMDDKYRNAKFIVS
jgi:nucleoside-diphosphate-sugar epimerase